MKLKTVIAVILTVLAGMGFYAGYKTGYTTGWRRAKDELPSCLYLDRPRQNDCKPWGYDGKEGVDWHYDKISGGGMYIDLSKWKRGW